jgi:hypothetical protein
VDDNKEKPLLSMLSLPAMDHFILKAEKKKHIVKQFAAKCLFAVADCNVTNY